jgi:hypothetical protein
MEVVDSKVGFDSSTIQQTKLAFYSLRESRLSSRPGWGIVADGWDPVLCTRNLTRAGRGGLPELGYAIAGELSGAVARGTIASSYVDKVTGLLAGLRTDSALNARTEIAATGFDPLRVAAAGDQL